MENSGEKSEARRNRNNKRKRRQKRIKAKENCALWRFVVSQKLTEALKAGGFESLFPIQAKIFETILNGADLVGLARGGQPKTLGFVLPILESICAKETRNTTAPKILVLLPTDELATQVYADFQYYGRFVGMSSCCLHWHGPHQPQGVISKRSDIIIGTPTCIKDHIERKKIDLTSLKICVLDEADQMLESGLDEPIKYILGKVEDRNEVQMLLFTCTLSDSVKQLSRSLLKKDKETIDLRGYQRMKPSRSVRHIVIPCRMEPRCQVIPIIIRKYNSGFQTLILTDTKKVASQLARLPGARALHGDILPAIRELILKDFRCRKFTILIATVVAARGLDIDNVQLIIQCEAPWDVEAYIHRSGRSNTRVAVMLYDPDVIDISEIERGAGVKFEHSDIPEAASVDAVEMITQVSNSVIPSFEDAAQNLLNTSSLSSVELPIGYTGINSRSWSVLSHLENHVTLHLKSDAIPMFGPSFAFGLLRNFIPGGMVESIACLSVTEDEMGAVFDVPNEDEAMFLRVQDFDPRFTINNITTLPALKLDDDARNVRFKGTGLGW